MTDFANFYDDAQIPYASKEEKAKLVASGEAFTITNVSERAGEYKGKRQEQWVITIERKNGDERLITMTKSANRDKHMENIAQNIPVTNVALTRVGKNNDVWAFAPAGVLKNGAAQPPRRKTARR